MGLCQGSVADYARRLLLPCSFLEEEDLPLTYREQVVTYILNLMGQASALAPVASANVDPFTSTGAYVPGGGSGFPAPGGSRPAGDPFTSKFPGPPHPALEIPFVCIDWPVNACTANTPFLI